MSLVNQMLQDLQQREACPSEPLAGLQPVATPPDPQPAPVVWRWPAALFAAAAVVVATAWWRTDAGSASDARIAVAHAPAATPVESVMPPVGMSRYRLDYRLQTPPLASTHRSGPPENQLASGLPAPVQQETETSPAAPAPPETTVVTIRATGNPASASRRAGLAAMRAGRPVEAERHFVELVTADPATADSHLLLHAALQAQSRYADARAVLSDALVVVTTPARVAQVLAHELLDHDEVRQALTVLERHRPAGFNDLAYETTLAAVYQRAGDHESAANLYELLTQHSPADPNLWVGLGISREASGQRIAAAKAFRRARASGALDDTLARYTADRLARLEAS